MLLSKFSEEKRLKSASITNKIRIEQKINSQSEESKFNKI